jgi:hypothetical protein
MSGSGNGMAVKRRWVGWRCRVEGGAELASRDFRNRGTASGESGTTEATTGRAGQNSSQFRFLVILFRSSESHLGLDSRTSERVKFDVSQSHGQQSFRLSNLAKSGNLAASTNDLLFNRFRRNFCFNFGSVIPEAASRTGQERGVESGLARSPTGPFSDSKKPPITLMDVERSVLMRSPSSTTEHEGPGSLENPEGRK